MTVRFRSRRGFTLIELLVTAVVAIIMLGAAMALFLRTVTEQHEQRRIAEMKRSAALVMGQLTTELRQAGLGRPRAVRLGTMNAGDLFPGSILVAEDHRIAFIADLPRPDSTFSGYSQLAVNQVRQMEGGTFPDTGLALINELNGTCDVVTDSASCKTDISSQLFDYPTSSSTHNCAQSPSTARTCPWSLNRYRSNEYIIVSDALGRWVERRLRSGQVYATTGNRIALELTTALPKGMFAEGANQGWVATPDRVFFRLNGKFWQRKQCWGPVGSGATLVLNAACPDNDPELGTKWESLANVGDPPKDPTFTYFKADGSPLPTPITGSALRLIQRVDILLELQRPRYPNTGDATPIRHLARGSITLRQ
jgi:type II secretory pathway pseudopilin PulG